MAAANSTYVKLWTGATPVAVACLTDVNFELSAETREATCKDNDGWRSYEYGMKGGSADIEGILDYSAGATSNPELLFDAISNATKLTVEIGTGVTGDPKTSGTCVVENYKESAPGVEQNVTYSASLRFSGEVVRGVYA